MKKIKLVAVLFFCCNSSLLANIYFNDGGVHDVDYAINEPIQIYNESFWDFPTTVNFLAGASLYVVHGSVGLSVIEDSILNVYGGVLDAVVVTRGNSTTSINAGNIMYARFDTHASSQLNIKGGILQNLNLWHQDSSIVNITGGTIYTTPHYSIICEDNSSTFITGGNFICDENFRISVRQYSTMLISGGINFIKHLSISDNSHAIIKGYNLKINDIDVPSGNYSGTRSGIMTGTLLDGTDFIYDLSITNNAILTVHNIPEPTTILLFGLSSLFLRKKIY